MHNTFDNTRHEGKNTMKYTGATGKKPESESSDMDESEDEMEVDDEDCTPQTESSDSEDESEDDDKDEINGEAYDNNELEGNGVQKSEQAGVLHLVHGWTQQAQPEKVRLFP